MDDRPLPDADDTGEEVGPRRDEAQGRTFPCERCGADLAFHIGAQALECPYCGHRKTIEPDPGEAVEEQDFRAMLETLAEQRRAAAGRSAPAAGYDCGSCGAKVTFEGTVISTECAYCGSPVQRHDVQQADDGRIPVDGVLPFRVDRESAHRNLREWVQSRWFAPSAFKKRGVDGRFNGVYLPYWTFDAATATRYAGERGEHYWVTVGSGKNRRRVRRTNWYPAGGAFQRFFDDVLVCAAATLPAPQVRALEPWPLEDVKPFAPELVAGHVAETHGISLEDGFRGARERMDQALRAETRRRIGGDTQRIHALATRFDAVTFKHLLLPLWLLTYRYGDRPYRLVVNAATGEVQGERPWSWIKIGLAAVLAAAVAIGAWALTRT